MLAQDFDSDHRSVQDEEQQVRDYKEAAES